jgi:hypothetical protein
MGFGLSFGAEFDIAPFAKRCCVADRNLSQVTFDYSLAEGRGPDAVKRSDGSYTYGLQWAEERDIREIRIHFRNPHPIGTIAVQYWFREWPYPPPHMPSMEDLVDDPWQGKWLNALTQDDFQRADCRITFKPLHVGENPRADNMPGVTYRRTIKLRLVFSEDPQIDQVNVLTGSTLNPLKIRVQLGAGEKAPHAWNGNIQVYNGGLRELRLWKGSSSDSTNVSNFHVTTAGAAKGLLLTLEAAEPSLPGSNDTTIVTVNAEERTFSFAIPDVEKGPVYVDPFHAYITMASDLKDFSPSIIKNGAEIREKLAKEPEQSYERASREIPAPNPVERENNGPLYLPLAVDSSWQKFAYMWGGNIYVSKQADKAKGSELKKLEWKGDRIDWRIGTGATPSFRPGWHDSSLATLDGYLPVAISTWSSEGIRYAEEGFATLLSGSLSPEAADRNEEIPSILMLKLTANNPGKAATVSHVWLATEPREDVTLSKDELLAENGQLVRARFHLPASAQISLGVIKDGDKNPNGLHITFPLEAGEEKSVLVYIPFIPRLTTHQREQLGTLKYDSERARVVEYWRRIAQQAVPFDVPEAHFMSFARAVVPHILISVTKDPKTGLYIDPAASYSYDIFANEAVDQCLMLDSIGLHQRVAEYLKTFVRLQGSVPMPGTFAGDQRAVYHGARVNAEYDYTMSPYDLDQGAVLWGLGEHYFFTRDKAWLSRNATSMMQAADWVVHQRRLTEVLDHGQRIPEYGLLPAGDLEDNSDWGHWFAVNALAAAGMRRLGEALRDIDSPLAAHYEEEANNYIRDLRDAIVRASQHARVIRLRNGTYVPWVPPRPYQRVPLFGSMLVDYYTRYPQRVLPLYRLSADREVLSGAIMLVLNGIFHPDEAVTDWILDDWEDNQTTSEPRGINVHGWVAEQDWFSRGGMVFQANLINPVLVYLYRNEIPAAIRNLYNDFVACHYPGANAFTEEYHQWVHWSGPFYKVSDEAKFVHRLRNLLVLEKGDTILLLEGTPQSWLEPGKEIVLTHAPTYFGPVSVREKSEASMVTAQVTLPSRNSYRAAYLILRYPGGTPIKAVEIDGKPWQEFDPATQRIRLPLQKEPMQISVHF